MFCTAPDLGLILDGGDVLALAAKHPHVEGTVGSLDDGLELLTVPSWKGCGGGWPGLGLGGVQWGEKWGCGEGGGVGWGELECGGGWGIGSWWGRVNVGRSVRWGAQNRLLRGRRVKWNGVR